MTSHGHLAIPESTDADFSLEVYQAMDGCLSCKACTSMCPIKVDIPELKAKFLNRFYTRYQRPLKDKLIAFSERTHHRLLAAPFLYNAGVKLPFFDSAHARLGRVSEYAAAQFTQVYGIAGQGWYSRAA